MDARLIVLFNRTEIVIGTATTSNNGTVTVSAEVGQYFVCCGSDANGGLIINGATVVAGISGNNGVNTKILIATATSISVTTQAPSYKTVSIISIT